MTMPTPGPWKVAEWDEMDGFIIAMSEDAAEGASYASHERIEYAGQIYPEDGEQYEEAEANARLIAAAPDLLEVAMLMTMEHDNDFADITGNDDAVCGCGDCEVARAAIAKATGQEATA